MKQLIFRIYMDENNGDIFFENIRMITENIK